MNLWPLKTSHYLWLLFGFLIVIFDLYFRVWSPLPSLEKEWLPAESVTLLKSAVVSEELISHLKSYQQTDNPTGQNQAASSGPVDARQFGEYYLGLYAIYQNKQQHIAILAVQEKSAPNSSKLLHWGLTQGNTDLTVVAIDSRSVTIQQGDDTITLRLFEKKQEASSAPEPKVSL